MELSYGSAEWCHTFTYDSDYGGWVTIGIMPGPGTVGKDLELYIQWQWKVRPTLIRAIPREGVVLCTGKGVGGQHRISVASNEKRLPIMVGFGRGSDGFPTGQGLYDISTTGWGSASHHLKRVREGENFWVEPKQGPLAPEHPLWQTPRMR